MSDTAEYYEERLEADFFMESHEDFGSFKLIEVTRHKHSMREGGAFSLVFETQNQAVLDQQIRTLVCGDFKRDLFLVPIGQDEQGTRYEAIFN